MSQYGIIYRMEFLNAEGFTVRVNISPTDILIPDVATPTVIPLTGSGTPVIVSASDNDEDKFTQIRSKSAKIQFVSDSSIGLDSSTFSQGGDNLWVCDIILQDTPEYIFRGFLMMADNQQPFQPDPQYVTLTATDHLAALKEIALVDYGGDNPIGKFKVGQFIAFCLLKTGLAFNIKVVNNLRAGSAQFTMATTFASGGNTLTVADTKIFYPGQRIIITGTVSNNATLFVKTVDSSTQITVVNTIASEGPVNATITDYNSQFHWYDKVELDSKTFEVEIGKCENCYSVLQKILGEDCFITQWNGEWWVFRVDEMEDNPVYVATFDSNGLYVSTAAGTQYDKSIGRNEDSKFANADALLRFVRPHQFVKEKFSFNTPLEVPCNVAFLRGTIVLDTPTRKIYTLDCWDKFKAPGNSVSTATVHLYVDYVDGYEVNRYIVFFDNGDFNFLQSEEIPVKQGDKFNIEVTRRMQSNHGSGGTDPCVQVRLYGNDGTFWTHHGKNAGAAADSDSAYWKACTSSFTTNQKFFAFEISDDQDDTQNIDLFSGEGAPVPIEGYLKILVYNSALYGATEDTYIQKVSFEYIPYINGTYERYSGQSTQIDRIETGYFANRDKEVSISDSPKPLLKGGMFLTIDAGSGDRSWLFPNWFNAATNGGTFTGLPSTDYLHPYGYIQAYSVWNQYKGYKNSLDRGIGINIFSGSIKGLTDNWPDLLHRYSLTDMNNQTNNRYFLLISLSQDWKSCLWTACFVEIYNRVILKSYNDPLLFKYVT